jgi:hypothetical protein
VNRHTEGKNVRAHSFRGRSSESRVHEAYSTRIKYGATDKKLWSPMPMLSSAMGPAVASVRTQTARTGAARGSNHVKSRST